MNPTLTDEVSQKYAWTAREVIQDEFSQLTVLGACCGGGEDGACCSTTDAGHVHDAEPAAAFGPVALPGGPDAGLAEPGGLGRLRMWQPHRSGGDCRGPDGPRPGLGLRRRRIPGGRAGRTAGQGLRVDMTNEMVALANSAKRSAGLTNVDFFPGEMEKVPLDDGSVDVVISNCSINLSQDKPVVFSEIVRVLGPAAGSRSATSWRPTPSRPKTGRPAGSYVDCIAGALSVGECTEALERAGFEDVRIDLTHPVADEMFAAAITGQEGMSRPLDKSGQMNRSRNLFGKI